MGIWFLTLIYNTIISKRNPSIMAKRDYNKFCEEFNKNWKDDIKSELGRKFLHLFTCSIIFFFWTLGKIFKSLGFFDTRFKNGFEDVDLCLKAEEAGFDCMYCSEAHLVHREYGSRNPDNDVQNYMKLYEKWPILRIKYENPF